MGSAGFPDGFIGLGVLAVLPIPLPVVVPGEAFGFVPIVGFPKPAVPEPAVPEDVAPELPVPAEPAPVPVAWASAAVLESASAPANANVVILIVVSFGRDMTNRSRRIRFRRYTGRSASFRVTSATSELASAKLGWIIVAWRLVFENRWPARVAGSERNGEAWDHIPLTMNLGMSRFGMMHRRGVG